MLASQTQLSEWPQIILINYVNTSRASTNSDSVSGLFCCYRHGENKPDSNEGLNILGAGKLKAC